jgi:hypothetical protein
MNNQQPPKKQKRLEQAIPYIGLGVAITLGVLAFKAHPIIGILYINAWFIGGLIITKKIRKGQWN